MKAKWMMAAAMVAGLASMASAAVVSYPSFDQSFSHVSTGSDYAASFGPVALDAGHVFNDGQSGSAVTANTRYFGGFFSYSPNSSADWGGEFILRFNYSGGNSFTFGKPGGQATFVAQGPTADAQPSNTGVSAVGGDIPFVVKFEDDVWNRATARVFIGAAAEAATEGTPTLSFTGLVSDISVVSVTLSYSHASWASGASSAELSGFFSATEWTPVSVPEPASLAMLGLAGLLIRRHRSA